MAYLINTATHHCPSSANQCCCMQVDGQVRLGLRPRQLTFTASTQPAVNNSSNTSVLLTHSPLAAVQPSPQPPSLMPASRPMQQQAAPAVAPHSAHGLHHSDSTAQASAADAPARVALTAAQSLPSKTSHPLADVFAAQQGAAEQATGPLGQQQGAWQEALSAPGAALQQAADFPGRLPSADAPASGQLSDSPPSLAWPGAAATAGDPHRQQSLPAAPPSRHTSGAVPLPSRQPSAVASTVIKQRSVLAPGPSRQASMALRPPSRQDSAAHVTHPHPVPDQAAVNSRDQGLEQAWAALLPTLLAQSTRQHNCLTPAQPSDATPAVSLDVTDTHLPVQAGSQQQEAAQQRQHEQRIVPSVQDILQMWAPLPKPASTGTTHCSAPVQTSKTCNSGMITRIPCLS